MNSIQIKGKYWPFAPKYTILWEGFVFPGEIGILVFFYVFYFLTPQIQTEISVI